ncbi:ABC-2 type transport system permease protein [Blastococcus aurantiacus]|uniref:Transport permease protein n=1 Tax=Blastococcus aurantiacus TaxID=1550231 RepID=A0A1G7PQZ2_9ACTN|nr:ABC transporter permease [Blastococcus aurantiacus]SDF88624.1 ABC-2 type transport system permease protein [Blastococcus aurantiacus]
MSAAVLRPATSRASALWRSRRIFALLVVRDLKVRYAGSALGWLWSVLDPLLMAVVYWFVFTTIFERTVGEEPYIVFLLAGLLPWTWFNGAVTDTARALRVDEKLVRSTSVQREVWVLRLVASKGLEFLLSLPVLAIFAVAFGADLHWQVVYAPLALVLQTVLLAGLGLLLSPLIVLVRDLERVVRIVLRLWFYVTPVIYGAVDIPEEYRAVFALNPLTGVFSLYRAAFFPDQVVWSHVATAAVVSVLVLVVGWMVFARLERTVLKEI